ncbi:MAG: hypothetical protein GY941_07660 [Planctomycetes bacterium]|nr:hypothetical protein [Planctomycetota bacterium]
MKIDQSWPEDGRQKGQVILGQLLSVYVVFTGSSEIQKYQVIFSWALKAKTF